MDVIQRTLPRTKTLFNRITHLRIAEERAKHHLQNLRYHCINGTTPKGISVKVSPTAAIRPTPHLFTQWATTLKRTETDLLTLLKNHTENQILCIKDELQEAKDILSDLVDDDDFGEFMYIAENAALGAKCDLTHRRAKKTQQGNFINQSEQVVKPKSTNNSTYIGHSSSSVVSDPSYADSTINDDDQTNSSYINSSMTDFNVVTINSSNQINDSYISTSTFDTNEGSSDHSSSNCSSNTIQKCNSHKKGRNRRFIRRHNDQSNINVVVNLSNHELTQGEKALLSRGLGFCPKPNYVNNMELHEDMESFYRRLRLRNHFYKEVPVDESNVSVSGNTDPPLFKKPSSWQPKKRDPVLESFVNAVASDIDSHVPPKDRRKNLSRPEQAALDTLSNNDSIIIKPADKGSAVVVINKSDYITEANKLLHNTAHYRKLSSDPTQEITDSVTQAIDSMHKNNHIDEDTRDFLTPEDPKPGRFYIIPKIHKPNIPYRPIISCNGHPTENLSQFLDYHLQPVAQSVPSYIRDTTDFLNKINGIQNLPQETYLCTMDVSSLYTNIPHDDGIQACFEALERRPIKLPPSGELCDLLKLTLTSNNFVFNGDNFLQVSGTLMGGKYAPPYATIFMGKLEQELISSFPLKPHIWYRFIDDIFFIWTHSEEDLTNFVHHANNMHPTIKFTHEYSKSSVSFLDVNVKMTSVNNSITTDLHCKPTDKHLYLQPSSCHPRHITRNIPYSLALRLRRICANDSDLDLRTHELTDQLIRRGYNKDTVTQQISKAKSVPRQDTLRISEKNTKSDRVPLVVTYHPNLPDLNGIIRKHWPIIQSHPRLNNAIPELPIIAYKRPKNLRDILIRAQIKPDNYTDQIHSCHPCNKTRCKTCTHMQNTTSFSSHRTGQSFKIRQDSDCDSSNVVYMIQCAQCGIQYIGETGTSFRLRMNNHRSTINNSQKHHEKPVATHFAKNNHTLANLQITIIENLGNQSKFRRQHREKFWISKLDTYQPNGLNIREK